MLTVGMQQLWLFTSGLLEASLGSRGMQRSVRRLLLVPLLRLWKDESDVVLPITRSIGLLSDCI